MKFRAASEWCDGQVVKVLEKSVMLRRNTNFLYVPLEMVLPLEVFQSKQGLARKVQIQRYSKQMAWETK